MTALCRHRSIVVFGYPSLVIALQEYYMVGMNILFRGFRIGVADNCEFSGWMQHSTEKECCIDPVRPS